MERSFSIKECFSVGWARFQSHAWFLVGVTLFIWGTTIVSAYLTEAVYGQIEPTRSLLDILSQIAYYWLCFGLIAISLKLVDGQSVSWADLFIFDRRFLSYIVGSILYGAVVVVGFFALIIPGIYLALRYGFFWYAIIDGHKGIVEAFRESARITHGVKWQLILFGLASMGVILLGMLFLGIGVLIAMPVTMLASAHLYRVLLHQASEASEPEVIPATPHRPENLAPQVASLPSEDVSATPSSESQESIPIGSPSRDQQGSSQEA